MASDEMLIDYWVICTADGTVIVTEEAAKAVKDAQAAHTVTVHDEGNVLRDCFIAPFQFDLIDLFGAETTVRLDQVGLITHSSPEAREVSRRQDELVTGKKSWETD